MLFRFRNDVVEDENTSEKYFKIVALKQLSFAGSGDCESLEALIDHVEDS